MQKLSTAFGIGRDASIDLQPASMVRRAIATGVDGIIWVGLAFAGYLMAMSVTYEMKSDLASWVAMAILYLSMPAYYLTEVFAPRTLGKRWAGITVIVLGEGGKGRGHRLRRWSLKSLPWFMALLYPLVASATENWKITKYILQTIPQFAERGMAYLFSVVLNVDSAEWFQFPLQAVYLSIKLIEPGLIPLLILVAGSLLIISPSRRTLLDRLSGTAVFRGNERSRVRGFEPLPLPTGAASDDHSQTNATSPCIGVSPDDAAVKAS